MQTYLRGHKVCGCEVSQLGQPCSNQFIHPDTVPCVASHGFGVRLECHAGQVEDLSGISTCKKTFPVLPALAVVEGPCLFRECFSIFLSTHYEVAVDAYETQEEMLSGATLDQYLLVFLVMNNTPREMVVGQLAKICRQCTHCPVIMMHDACDYSLVSEVLRVGARGVFTTDCPADLAAEAIKLVLSGGSFIPTENMIQFPVEPVRPGPVCPMLTTRESEVLCLLKAGQQNKQIAFSLGISEGTVKVHLHNIMKKLGTSNRTQTIVEAAKTHVI